MTDWPLSRYQVRLALTKSGITPLRKPHDIVMIDGSAVYDYCRFLVPLSHLACETLPMSQDALGNYVDDAARLRFTIARAFTESISDIVIARERMRYLATFTIYMTTDTGRATFKARRDNYKVPWNVWAQRYK